MKTLGERVTAERVRLDSSKVKLARRVGISDSALGAIERGEKSPRKLTIEAIARALDVSVEWLVSGNGLKMTSKAMKTIKVKGCYDPLSRTLCPFVVCGSYHGDECFIASETLPYDGTPDWCPLRKESYEVKLICELDDSAE